jgi:hypothetical protein
LFQFFFIVQGFFLFGRETQSKSKLLASIGTFHVYKSVH